MAKCVLENVEVVCPHEIFLSVEQLSSTVCEAGTNPASDKRLGESFYNRVDYVADRIVDESEIRRGNSSRIRTQLERFPPCHDFGRQSFRRPTFFFNGIVGDMLVQFILACLAWHR